MKALLCVEHGPPEKLVVQDVPEPEPGKGEVRIVMKAAGVNFPDVLIIQNLYQFKPPLPFSPGGEAAGVVDAVGEGVARFKVGDRVIAMIGNGAFREQFLADESKVIPMAGDMPFDVAAGFTMTYGTSHHALKQRARLQPGETLLVLGAAGGVGCAAIDLGEEERGMAPAAKLLEGEGAQPGKCLHVRRRRSRPRSRAPGSGTSPGRRARRARTGASRGRCSPSARPACPGRRCARRWPSARRNR